MKLSDVTDDYIISQYVQHPYLINRPEPTILTWLTLALQFKNNIAPYSVNNPESCWVWERPKNKLTMFARLGNLTQFGLQIKRFAFYFYGLECEAGVLQKVYEETSKVPKKFIHNSCPTKRCVNPAHLFESFTAYDPSNVPHTPQGTDCRSAKLTEQQVKEIHASTAPLKELADTYKVSKTAVHLIQTGRTWSYLNLVPRPLRYKTHTR